MYYFVRNLRLVGCFLLLVNFDGVLHVLVTVRKQRQLLVLKVKLGLEFDNI